jgi:uncharacterized SAM-binding protein YcdF (DUF218 family)
MRATLRIFLILLTLWAVSFLWFVAQIPTHPSQDQSPTDAIVVLTGGSGRVEKGFELWSEGLAQKLFISGVGKGVNMNEIYSLAGQQTPRSSAQATPATRIVLGYEATDTRGNAKETAEWMAREGFKSARLVTGNYHMPRSLMEFRHTMPDITFVPEPVISTLFHIERWWRYPGTAKMIFSEYYKLMLSAVDHLIHTLLAWHQE